MVKRKDGSILLNFFGVRKKRDDFLSNIHNMQTGLYFKLDLKVEEKKKENTLKYIRSNFNHIPSL